MLKFWAYLWEREIKKKIICIASVLLSVFWHQAIFKIKVKLGVDYIFLEIKLLLLVLFLLDKVNTDVVFCFLFPLYLQHEQVKHLAQGIWLFTGSRGS